MSIFQVMREQGLSPSTPDAIGAVLVEERFSWLAFWLPPVWALAHRLWLEALGWLFVTLVLCFAGGWLGDGTCFWLYVLFALWMGFEASSLRLAALQRRGYRPDGFVIAAGPDLAEMEWLKREAVA